VKRRAFITALAAAAAWPRAARAQQGGKIPTVGYLWHAGSADEEGAALVASPVFLAMGLPSVPTLLWISPELQVPNRATVSVVLLAIAVLLWIARWANNRLKHHRS